MLVVLPFCHRDAALALHLATEIARLGNCGGHQAMVVASTLAGEHAPKVKATLERAGFDYVSDWVLPVTVEKGWPTSPNYVFREVAMELMKRKNPMHWFFMEPDCTPIGDTWLLQIEDDYLRSGKQYSGAVVPTRVMRGGIEGVDGSHLVGAGIYPADAFTRMTLLRWAIDEPWDVYCQWEVLPHAHNSPLFQHNWNTRNYRREGEQIVCSSMNHLSLVQPLRPGVALLHGCKDASLIRLLSAVATPRVEVSQQVQEAVLLEQIAETLRPARTPPPAFHDLGSANPFEILAAAEALNPSPPLPRKRKKRRQAKSRARVMAANLRPRDPVTGRLLPKQTVAIV